MRQILTAKFHIRISASASDFQYIGSGWCRSGDCNYSPCHVNGYRKDGSNSRECRSSCLQERSCTGYAISTQQHPYPNRCYVHGNISSMNSFSGWNIWQKPHSVPTYSSGSANVECWRRTTGIKISKDVYTQLT